MSAILDVGMRDPDAAPNASMTSPQTTCDATCLKMNSIKKRKLPRCQVPSYLQEQKNTNFLQSTYFYSHYDTYSSCCLAIISDVRF